MEICTRPLDRDSLGIRRISPEKSWRHRSVALPSSVHAFSQLPENFMIIHFYRADLANVTAAELRRRIPDLTERIQCQRARLENIRLVGTGQCDEMEALLADMIVRRDAMQARLADIEVEPFRVKRGRPTRLRLVPRAVEALPPTEGWHVELSCGRVSLQKSSSKR